MRRPQIDDDYFAEGNAPAIYHAVQVEYTHGYTYHPRGVCTCGWHGPIRRFTFRAMRDANRHRLVTA